MSEGVTKNPHRPWAAKVADALTPVLLCTDQDAVTMKTADWSILYQVSQNAACEADHLRKLLSDLVLANLAEQAANVTLVSDQYEQYRARQRRATAAALLYVMPLEAP